MSPDEETRIRAAFVGADDAASRRAMAEMVIGMFREMRALSDRCPTREELQFLREQWSEDKWRAETWRRVQRSSVVLGVIVGILVAWDTVIDKLAALVRALGGKE